MAEMTDILNSGEVSNINLGGTGPDNAAMTKGSFLSVMNTATEGLPLLPGYAAGGDNLLLQDTSGIVKAPVSHIPGHMEIVQAAGDLGYVLSLAEIMTMIPAPVLRRTYLVKGTGGNAFMAVWDGIDWWFERLSKCV